MIPTPDVVLALASGVPLIVLGAFLLTLRPRSAEATFFGTFAILWGLQVVTANGGHVLGSDADAYTRLLLVTHALAPPAYLFLTYVTARTWSRARAWPVIAAATGVAVLAGGVLALRPALVVAGVDVTAGTEAAVLYGPAAVPLFHVPFFGAFYLGVIHLYAAYRNALPGSPRHRVRGLLLALALVASYATTWTLGTVLAAPGGGVTRFITSAAAAGFTGLFLGGAIVLVSVLVHHVTRPPPPGQVDPVLVAALTGPALVALVEMVVGASGMTLGAWRILAVAVLVHGLARHRLFDLDLRLKRAAGPAIAITALACGLVVGALLVVDERSVDAALVPALAGVASSSAAWAWRERVGDALFPGVSTAPDYLRQRKLEIYRGRLERVLVAPTPRKERELTRLRRRLGISEREHEVMAYMVREKALTAPGDTSSAIAPATAPVAPGQRVADRYRVDRLLGEGGHGRAFLAYDEDADQEVVLKTVGTSLLGGRGAHLLVREARVAGALRHPNVVRVLDVVETPHEAIMIMEYADGGSLLDLLQRRSALPLPAAARVLDGVLAGLEAAHARGLVHRDVKPGNVLLTRDGSVKLTDFGIAQDKAGDATGLTGGAVGTLLYMSPEQVRGVPVDPRSDLYAAAVLFHHALTSRFYLRVTGKDDFQIRRLILEENPRLDVDDQPAWVRDVLAKALEKAPSDRYASAGEMRAVLAANVPGLREQRLYVR